MAGDPDANEEPLEFCAGFGHPHLFSTPLQKGDMQEIAETIQRLPRDFTQNRMRLGFGLWCAGRTFEREVDEVAVEHRLI